MSFVGPRISYSVLRMPNAPNVRSAISWITLELSTRSDTTDEATFRWTRRVDGENKRLNGNVITSIPNV